MLWWWWRERRLRAERREVDFSGEEKLWVWGKASERLRCWGRMERGGCSQPWLLTEDGWHPGPAQCQSIRIAQGIIKGSQVTGMCSQDWEPLSQGSRGPGKAKVDKNSSSDQDLGDGRETELGASRMGLVWGWSRVGGRAKVGLFLVHRWSKGNSSVGERTFRRLKFRHAKFRQFSSPHETAWCLQPLTLCVYFNMLNNYLPFHVLENR